jgi:hypothetical protein
MGQPRSGRVLDRLNSSIRNALSFLTGFLWMACFEPVSRQTKASWFNVPTAVLKSKHKTGAKP